MGIKNEAPRTVAAFEASFYVDIRFVLTYLREFQPLRKYFQLVRTEMAFNSGELCLILASIDFVGTKAGIMQMISVHTLPNGIKSSVKGIERMTES